MNYEQTAHDLAPTAAFWATGLLAPHTPLEQLGALALETSARLRTLAILALLARGDHEQFLANLSRSAGAWCRFLRRVREAEAAGVGASAGVPHLQHVPHFVSGRTAPLFDAVAAGDLPLVREIGALAPAGKQGRKEYEDDYCTAQLVFALAGRVRGNGRDGDDGDDGECLALLERWAAWSTPSDPPRLRAFAALVARDAAAFEDALQGVLQGFEAASAATKERGSEQTVAEVANQAVSIEGLALLRLAAWRGIATAMIHRFCPPLARLPATRALPRDFA